MNFLNVSKQSVLDLKKILLAARNKFFSAEFSDSDVISSGKNFRNIG